MTRAEARWTAERAEADERVDQRRAGDLERPTDRGLAGAAVKRRRDLLELLTADHRWSAAAAPSALGCCESDDHTLPGELALELRQRTEQREQQLAVRCPSVHRLGERAEGDAALPQVAHDLQEVWEAAAEPVELPHHEVVARLEIGDAGLQPGPVVPGSGGVVLVEVPVVDAGGHERVALQVDRLALVGRRHPHVPDQHVRKISQAPFPHITSIRQGLSCIFPFEGWRATV